MCVCLKTSRDVAQSIDHSVLFSESALITTQTFCLKPVIFRQSATDLIADNSQCLVKKMSKESVVSVFTKVTMLSLTNSAQEQEQDLAEKSDTKMRKVTT